MTERRKLGHDLRNGMNTLVLNMQCLPITTGDEAIECVDAVIAATDTIVNVIDQLAQCPDEIPGASPTP